jgi:hypothetical protein
MKQDVFGNLKDWGPVIERIEALQAGCELDAHQEGLARILRYRDNWRLRETVLNCVKHHIRRPSDELLQGVLAIMMDESIYHEARLMAAEALLSGLGSQNGTEHHRDRGRRAAVIEKMDTLLEMPAAPVFQQGIRCCRDRLAAPLSPQSHRRPQRKPAMRSRPVQSTR